MKRVVYYLLMLGISLLPSISTVFAQGDDGEIDDKIFKKVLPILQKKCAVPPVLPTFLVSEQEDHPLYAAIIEVTKHHYEIEIAFEPECNNVSVCHFASATGRVSDGKRPAGKKVKLANNITGYFEESECGASCSDAFLLWDSQGYRYGVSLKAGNEEDLIEMANSAIEN